jgi:zinc transport system permease protein
MFEALQFEFMRNAIIAGLLAAIACGIVGTYVVTKKIVFISGGIAHSSFGGIGLGYLININPVIGATIFALVSSVGIGLISRRTRLPEDTAIGLIWTIGMALGIVFIALSPGYAPDLFSYLFGNILTVPVTDLIIMFALDIIILALVITFYKEFLAISFDENYSTVIGIPVEALYLTLLIMIALTVIVLIRVVGIILVIALLTMPAAMASRFTFNFRKMMLLSVLFGVIFTMGGLWLSYALDLPSGATIILFGGLLIIIAYIITRIRNTSRRKSPTVNSQI